MELSNFYIFPSIIEGEHENFFKSFQLTFHAIIFRQRTFFSIIKLVFQEKLVILL